MYIFMVPLKKISFTDAREGLSSLIDEVQKSGQAVAITRHGRPAAVLMSMEALEQKMRAMEKGPWKLRNSGTWLGDSVDVDQLIREMRQRSPISGEKRLKKLSKKVSGK